MLASSMNAGKRDNVLCIFSEIVKGVINAKTLAVGLENLWFS